MENSLTKIIQNPHAHAKLVSALARLEYVGARKIAKALPAQYATPKHLEHLMEEASHATMLAYEAEQLFVDAGLSETVAEGDFLKDAEAYLQAVDRGIETNLKDQFGEVSSYQVYLMVSLIIEERAMSFYPMYHRLLREGSIKNTVREIMRDEVGHLEEMQMYCNTEIENYTSVIERCRQVEETAFQTKLLPLLKELAN